MRLRSARAVETWTVLEHGPLEKLTENLWTVEGATSDRMTRRRMTIARMSDGRLVVHDCIALEEPLMAELERFGAPCFLLVPGRRNRHDARAWKERFPSMKVLCPRGARSDIAEVVHPDGSYDDLSGDREVRAAHLCGTADREGVVEVISADGRSVVFNDCVANVALSGGLRGFLLAPTGQPAVPRAFRWRVVEDPLDLQGHLVRLSRGGDLRRIIPAQGAIIDREPTRVLTQVAETLR